MPERNKELGLMESWFNRNGITAILLDLDDTLLKTNDLFGLQMRRFISAVVSKDSRINWGEAWAIFIKYNDNAFETMAVREEKLTVVAEQLDSHFDSKPIFSNHSDIIMQIYHRVPELTDGALQALNSFSEINKPMSLVTHANKAWTDMKVYHHGLQRYFSHIEIVDETRHKGYEDWQRAADHLHVLPEQTLVIGDNLKGDIISAYEAGVRHGVWIKPEWSIYSQGDIPDGVIRVDSISQIVGILAGQV